MDDYTERPWRAYPFDPRHQGAGWVLYGDDDSGPDRVYLCEVERAEDAHLIAAAPDLLDALTQLVADYEVERMEWDPPARAATQPILDAARAALAKARGDD